MIEVIIIGAGGHGAELDEYIQYDRIKGQKSQIQIIGFLDDNPDSYNHYAFSAPLLGDIKNHQVRSDCQYIIGIANLDYRRMIVESFLSKGARFMSFIHPTAYISPSAKLETGCIVGPNANIGPNVKVGSFNLINSRCSLGHDTELGDYNFICPNVCFSGFTKVGDDNLFGINSATIPSTVVGNRNKIAAGLVLSKPVHDDVLVYWRYKERTISLKKL
ncbi:MAG: acetyltransferase [Carboxylicivirga sp.]|jgi:sugar O-acyltransferase (sialic acid O-acetyltransferase NeuD family)|nr:acetyltransferase [Carboxylicivirga sp.]